MQGVFECLPSAACMIDHPAKCGNTGGTRNEIGEEVHGASFQKQISRHGNLLPGIIAYSSDTKEANALPGAQRGDACGFHIANRSGTGLEKEALSARGADDGSCGVNIDNGVCDVVSCKSCEEVRAAGVGKNNIRAMPFRVQAAGKTRRDHKIGDRKF